MSIKIYKDGKWQILPGQGSPGKSAYDYASENGFVGSEEDFANALGSIDDIADKIENIDTKPTEGSNNLVTSGGVHKALKDLSITGDVDLSNQLNEVEENIDTLYNRTNDNEKNINAIIDILKGEEEWPDDWVPGDSACCETLRDEVSELEDRVSIIESTGGSGTVDVEKLKETFDNRYLVKVEDSEQNVNNDTVFHKNVDINGNLTVDNVKSTDFVSGMAIGGAGFSLYNDETENGKSSVLEVDKLYVRKEAHFAELVIDQIRFSLGETVFSNGGATISEVDDTNPDYYKCYYEKTRQENGKEITGIESGFIVGDLARCQRFDAENNLLKYYWCKVVEVGDDYFCLSKTDKDDTGLDVNISKPEAGDDVVQLGNATKTDRQSAVIISPFNGGSVAIFSGINSYSLSDRNYIGLGTYYENGEYKSKIYGYGDMYFGVRPGQEGHYIKFDGEKLTINGDVIIGEDDIKDVTINNKTLVNWLKDLAEKTDQYDIDFWSGPDLVVDGRLEMSDTWIADGLAENHLGDRYTCTTDGTMWQFTKNGDGEDATYLWVEQDSLSNDEVNNLIQSALDGHRRVFTEQPKGPYDIGDLWIYTSVDSTELYICVKDNNVENSYSESDWKNVTETAYAKIKELEESIKNLSVGTDDSVNFYFDEKEDILTESNSWSEDEKSGHTGDLSYAIDEDKSYKWDGTSWVDITGSTYHNILKSLYTTSSAVDGKIEITFCPKEEPIDPSHGDLYYNCNNELLSWDSDNNKWISLNDLSELEYLTSLFKNNVITDGVVIGDMLAVVDSDNNVVAGIYGGGNDNLNDNFEHEWYGTRMIFAGANNVDSNATFATSVFEDGTIITEGEQGTITIRENDIFIDSKSSKGGIYLGFDDNGAPILSYKDSEDNNIWNLKEGGLGFTPIDGVEWPESGEFKYNANNNVWTLGGDLLVTGGVSFYSTLGDYKIGNIMDGINVDNTSIGINESNQLYVKNTGSSGVDESAVVSIINSYGIFENTITEMQEAINGLAGGGEVDLTGYVKTSDFESYKTTAALKTDLETYATKDSLNNYITTEAANNYALKNDLEDYLMKSDAQSTYATISEFNMFKSDVSNTYATKSDLNTHVAAFDEHKTAFETFKTSISKNFASDNITANSSLVSNNGLTVNDKKLTCTNGVWQLDGDLLVTGGVSFYSSLDSGAFSTVTSGVATTGYIENNGSSIYLNYDSLVSQLELDGIGSGSSANIDLSDYYTKSEVNSQISSSISAVVNNAPEAFDTLKEISDWIASDETGTAAIIQRITNLENKEDKNTTYDQATANTLGLVKIGYTENGKNYPVKLSNNGQMYVNVPWTDNNTTYSIATASSDGLMSNTMYSKLSGIEYGAQANTITGVKGESESSYRTGKINITKSNIGLGNVDNTADSVKEVAYADQARTATSATSATTSSTCTGNAATATKLKTSVELWGNSFDGLSNITGNISITTTNPCISFLESDKSNDKYNIQTNSGYLYIGHSASDYYSLSTKFDSSGNVEMPANLTVKGGITFYSQKSLKNIHETDFLSLDQLSNIHAIKYTWKDGRDDRMHVGGIADDIQKIIPEVIYENDGYLTMDYGNAGFVIGTSLIKPVVNHEKRIKELEEEVARLNNLLNA